MARPSGPLGRAFLKPPALRVVDDSDEPTTAKAAKPEQTDDEFDPDAELDAIDVPKRPNMGFPKEFLVEAPAAAARKAEREAKEAREAVDRPRDPGDYDDEETPAEEARRKALVESIKAARLASGKPPFRRDHAATVPR